MIRFKRALVGSKTRLIGILSKVLCDKGVLYNNLHMRRYLQEEQIVERREHKHFGRCSMNLAPMYILVKRCSVILISLCMRSGMYVIVVFGYINTFI